MPPEANKISHTLYLLLSTLLLVSLITYTLPESVFEIYSLKKIDFIEPILAEKAADTLVPSVTSVPVKAVSTSVVQMKKAAAPCPKGIVCIEDFSEDKKQGEHFLEALSQTAQHKGNCRIAFYGDSFIEGDILTSDLRDTLQHVFGGKGVGFLPISSEVSMFRRSLPSEADGWSAYTVGKSSPVAPGISGHAYQAKENAQLVLHPNQALSSLKLLFRNAGEEATITSLINRKQTVVDTLPSSDRLQFLPLAAQNDSIKQYTLSLSAHKNLTVYGLSVEQGAGVYLDNFSLRGNSGLGLATILDEQFLDFQAQMNYKLVILEFGLNVAAPSTKAFTQYETNMTKMILHLKTLFPETTFLLLSTSDRSTKQNGSYATMPSIPLLVEAQRRIAQKSGILYWNLFAAMGGENSMVEFVKHKPALANKDYTHLTFPGGKKIASALAKSLLQDYARFQHQKKVDYAPVAVK